MFLMAKNKAISETAVTISGLTTGRLFTERAKLTKCVLCCLPNSAKPRAPAVPIRVEMMVAIKATETLIQRQSRSVSLVKSSSYHLRENPPQFVAEFEALNEKTTTEIIGR